MAKDQEHLSRAERERRVMDCFPLVVDGFRFAQIKEIVAKKCRPAGARSHPGASHCRGPHSGGRTCRVQTSREVRRGGRLLERLRLRASMGGDLSTALRVQRELNRLYGLLAPERHEIGGAAEAPLEVVVRHVGRDEWPGT